MGFWRVELESGRAAGWFGGNTETENFGSSLFSVE
jgi:hypothetical protein